MAVVVLWGGWATAVAAWGPCGPPQGQQPCPRHLGGWCVGWVGMGRGVVVARACTVAARLLCWWLIFPRSAGKQERRCNDAKMASTEVAEVAGGFGVGLPSLQAPQTPATAQPSANCSGVFASQQTGPGFWLVLHVGPWGLTYPGKLTRLRRAGRPSLRG